MSVARYITRTILNPGRLAGALLAASLSILIAALIILVASGALPAFSSGLQGSLSEKAPHAATFRRLNLLWTVGWMAQLLGFAVLTYLLLRAGEDTLAILPFITVLVAAILGILHGSFHMSVETWAAVEAARTGNTPAVYEPLRAWIGAAFRVAHVVHLAGTAGFGLGILHARLLPPWLGWATFGWSILWLVSYLVGAGAPGVLFIMPAIIGIGLLRRE